LEGTGRRTRSGRRTRGGISIDINPGDTLLGWDTDQFPNLKGGGFTAGGLMFDAKMCRPSIDPEDRFHAHIGALHTLLAAPSLGQDDAGPCDCTRPRREVF
jgi:xylose isomerase